MGEISDNDDVGLRKWSISRIASAILLALIVLGGAAYGIYSLVSSGPSKPSVTHHVATNQSAKSPKAATTTPPSTKSTTGESSSPNTNSNVAPSSGNLTNTGPGEDALIWFGAATAIGTAGHYLLRRFTSRRM
jgi:hypothetical protein